MQIGIFDGSQKFIINKPIRLIELFGGYGSQAFALKYLGANFEHWKLCEWAVKSIQAYKDAHFKDDDTDYSKDHSIEFIVNRLTKLGISANYNEPMTKDQTKRLGEEKQRQIYNNIKATHNLVNIMQVHAEDLEIKDTDKYTYVMTYSFPCQDLSTAGKQAGMEKGSGTRSGLLWEVERILDECENLPQVLLMENVPEVIGTNNIKHFAQWLAKLESLGYKCYWQVLNAKDYGVPQNRERCFMVSVLGDYYYNFPQPFKLEHKLKDLLEDEVDEKYYLSDRAITGMLNTNFTNGKIEHRTEKDGVMPTLDTRCDCLGVVIKADNKRLKQLASNMDLTKDGQFLDCYNQTTLDDTSTTITTRIDDANHFVYNNLRIRKLTPKECFRLMGVRDADFENIAQNQSNASLYHLAGDSIVVDVLMAIFKNMLGETKWWAML